MAGAGDGTSKAGGRSKPGDGFLEVNTDTCGMRLLLPGRAGHAHPLPGDQWQQPGAGRHSPPPHTYLHLRDRDHQVWRAPRLVGCWDRNLRSFQVPAGTPAKQSDGFTTAFLTIQCIYTFPASWLGAGGRTRHSSSPYHIQ